MSLSRDEKFFGGLTSQLDAVVARRQERGGMKYSLDQLMIETKSRKLISLSEANLNPAQKLIIHSGFMEQLSKGEPLTNQRHIILKPRQIGSSTICVALLFLDTITNPNTNTLILAHEKSTAQILLNKCKLFWRSLGNLAPIVGLDNAETLEFPEINSQFTIATSKSKNAGRGGTKQNFMGTEVAFWDNVNEILSGVYESVPIDGNIILESTANGEGDYFHRQFLTARSGDNDFKPHFYPWNMMPEYVASPEEMGVTEESLRGKGDTTFGNEREIRRLHSLSLEQIAFRRLKIRNKPMDALKTFCQEYPLTEAEAFVGSGQTLFDGDALAIMKQQQKTPGFLKNHIPAWCANVRMLLENPEIELFSLPVAGRQYLIACDPSEGLDGDGNHDYSSIMVFDLLSWEVVMRVSSRRVSPLECANVCMELGRWFNFAMLMVERNNHGHAVLQKICESDVDGTLNYPIEKVYHHVDFENTEESVQKKKGNARKAALLARVGFPCSVKTKKLSLDYLKMKISEQAFIIYSLAVFAQLGDYRKLDGGKTGCSKGNHDDDVSVLRMIAYYLYHAEGVVNLSKMTKRTGATKGKLIVVPGKGFN